MARTGFLLIIFFPIFSSAQSLSVKLKNAFTAFESDSQLTHAISSLYILEAGTGKIIFERNSRIGLAAASTQKIITAATAFDILGRGFKYQTRFCIKGDRIYIEGNGDPTLGSNRYNGSSAKDIFSLLVLNTKKSGIPSISGVEVNNGQEHKLLPSGWIYEDIGNYYGAGIQPFSWNENQYDLIFIPGKKKGDPTTIDSATLYHDLIINRCMTGAEGSGDNAYIYFLPGSDSLFVNGTVPAGVSRFRIRGADPFPEQTFLKGLSLFSPGFVQQKDDIKSSTELKPLFSHNSPSLDSINYWFLRESINLYGEALIYTLGNSHPDSGLQKIRTYWKGKGLDEWELNMYDGSGLSPLNRVTTHAQVHILEYARRQPWFQSYLAGFKDTNGMKMKSGTINNVKGYCGYFTSVDGKEYIFSFLVNNYHGRSATLVSKMFRVLDQLK